VVDGDDVVLSGWSTCELAGVTGKELAAECHDISLTLSAVSFGDELFVPSRIIDHDVPSA